MKNLFYYDTKIGKIGIEEDGIGITKVYYVDKDYDYKQSNLKETNLIKLCKEQINEYLEGIRVEFELPLSAQGTEFQMKVWKELTKIPYGETRSYKEIAVNIGNENAARAVGMANNKNPIMIIIPCHRVIGSNGNLIGYEGGLELKKKLINIEKNNTNN